MAAAVSTGTTWSPSCSWVSLDVRIPRSLPPRELTPQCTNSQRVLAHCMGRRRNRDEENLQYTLYLRVEIEKLARAEPGDGPEIADVQDPVDFLLNSRHLGAPADAAGRRAARPPAIQTHAFMLLYERMEEREQVLIGDYIAQSLGLDGSASPEDIRDLIRGRRPNAAGYMGASSVVSYSLRVLEDDVIASGTGRHSQELVAAARQLVGETKRLRRKFYSFRESFMNDPDAFHSRMFPDHRCTKLRCPVAHPHSHCERCGETLDFVGMVRRVERAGRWYADAPLCPSCLVVESAPE